MDEAAGPAQAPLSPDEVSYGKTYTRKENSLEASTPSQFGKYLRETCW